MKIKRIVIATLLGVVFGFVCLGFAASNPQSTVPMPVALQIIFSRTLIGFAIGISSLRINWAIQGILFGLLFSLPMGFSNMMADIPGFTKTSMFVATNVMGMIYGFLIELITSVLFKAKAE